MKTFMRAPWHPASAFGALLFLTAARPAAATPLQDARERFLEGNRLFAAGEYDAARLAYEQSLVLVPHGATFLNLGLVEMKLGDPVRALAALRRARSAPDLQPERRAATEHELDDAYAATGHILVRTSPGASISLDGHDLEGPGLPTDPIDLAVGPHTLEARIGERSAKADVEAKAGLLLTIDLPLIDPPAPAMLPVTESAVDGPADLVSESPGAPTEPDLPRSIDPSSYWTLRREVGLGVGGAGLVAFAVGAYFASQASSEQDRAATLAVGVSPGACTGAAAPGACGPQKDAWSAQHSDATASRVLFAVGGATVVGGAAVILWPDPSRSRHALQPFVSPYGGGVQLLGEF
jgi:hypothetical protein